MATNQPSIQPLHQPIERERGSGEIAGEVVINEIRVPSSGSSATNRNARATNTPRRTTPTDGRRGWSRNYNVFFPASLPPSTGSARAINVDRLEQGYTSIAESINNLAYQQRIRKRIDINKDLQHHVQMKSELQAQGADELIIATVLQTIRDLKEERVIS